MKLIKFIFVLSFVFFILGCDKNYSYTLNENIMDTDLSITVHGENQELLEKSVNEAFFSMKLIESKMNIYNQSTQLYSLNEKKEISTFDNDISYVINKSIYYYFLTDGAFDITVQPILELYKYTFGELKRPPTDLEVERILKRVGSKNIKFFDNKIQLNNDAKITLGGIAKGYAIDKAIESLKNDGVKSAIVNVGGDIRTIGNKDGKPWKIGLQNPRNSEEYIDIVELENRAIATSGDYERYYDSEMKVHHIIDPKTGESAKSLISVTVIADTAIEADALSTSVFVLGPEKGLNLINSLDNTETIIITEEREIFKSKGIND